MKFFSIVLAALPALALATESTSTCTSTTTMTKTVTLSKVHTVTSTSTPTHNTTASYTPTSSVGTTSYYTSLPVTVATTTSNCCISRPEHRALRLPLCSDDIYDHIQQSLRHSTTITSSTSTMELTPRASRSSSTSSRKSNLTLDLSNLPPLSQPTPPSNTLLFTNLNNLDVFTPENLQTIRNLVAASASIHAFAPLRSFRRILISFYDVDAAIAVRQVWDGEAVMGERLRVYFGQHTPVEARDEHLALPDAGKLFFISPPPSPPHGWEVKLEDAPNKQVHAEDLADALAKLHHRPAAQGLDSPVSPNDERAGPGGRPTRSRSSTLIYRPEENGDSPDLPAVFVEDMTDEPEDLSPMETDRPIMAHTSRPPVELMQDV